MINFNETRAAITLLHCGVILYFFYFSNKEIYNKSNIYYIQPFDVKHMSFVGTMIN